jgi:acyl-CoA thioester hydrolase
MNDRTTAGTATADGVSHTEVVQVYFDDLDAFGMLYHGRFAALLERAITTHLASAGLAYGHPDLNVAVRELHLVFMQPVVGLQTVQVTFWIQHLGATSATFGFHFHSDDVMYAHGHRVVVKMDPVRAVPSPWTPQVRRLLEAQLTRVE